MLSEYHRPTSLDEALALLQRPQPRTVPLAGGTALVRPTAQPLAVVDLQALGLNRLLEQGNMLVLGATLTLQALLEWLQRSGRASALAQALAGAIRHEAAQNLRQAATVGGTLAAAGGRSPLVTALLALDAIVTLAPGEETVGLGDLLPVRSERLPGRLITQIVIPANAALSYEYTARTPADRPLVCAAAARWPSGRVRLALGGFGGAPTLAMDGTEPDGGATAARSAFSRAGDAWASSEYRSDAAGVLAARCLSQLV